MCMRCYGYFKSNEKRWILRISKRRIAILCKYGRIDGAHKIEQYEYCLPMLKSSRTDTFQTGNTTENRAKERSKSMKLETKMIQDFAVWKEAPMRMKPNLTATLAILLNLADVFPEITINILQIKEPAPSFYAGLAPNVAPLVCMVCWEFSGRNHRVVFEIFSWW